MNFEEHVFPFILTVNIYIPLGISLMSILPFVLHKLPLRTFAWLAIDISV